ncbi:hypothetical protein C8Q78DRAFT_1019773 [Trametes maxima]|nr:hypothetical protein C8Q78DRAFT_1019773 [Trametes maxima]
MDPTPAVAGPSSLPQRRVTTHEQEKRQDDKRKRLPKRKRVASEAAGTEDGEVSSSEAPPVVYSTPWIDTLGTTEYENKEHRLHDEIVAFFEYMTPTPDERHARAVVIAQVAEVVKRRLPKATVDTFGSVAQDLYLPDGDTDLVITTPHPYDDETKKRVLFQLAALMRNAGVTDHVQVVHRARVPVISFQTAPDLGSLKIDISLNATDGLRAVPILRGYFERMPALRYLVLALKCLLTRHGLNSASSSGLSSYGLICIVIGFLQLNPMGRPAAYIEQPLQNKSLGALLIDFLAYYADTFPYETSYISAAQGKLLPKEDKGWVNEAHPQKLSIECLINPDNDVGRPTSKIQAIRALFRATHALLQASTSAEGPVSFNILAFNILGNVIGVSETTLAHRILLKNIVTSGRLMQALQDVQRSQLPQNGPGRRPPPSTAQQPYPPRQYSRPGSGPPSGNGRQRDGGPPMSRGGAGLPAKPPAHPSLPARPAPLMENDRPSGRAQGPSIGSMRGGGGGGGGGRLIDRLDGPQPARRRRT